ncbi:hypothetical protein EMPS_08692 [Entomortierella parvispora]|uniref:Uncharacterized protein n=1 Tax=Entomortierella parvispora TaxID=205924 RepID=A0A9P3HGW1_9FUNG|nr:hypothetical protein EMPS_08692 [Entomortierella parvispora]
MSGGNKEWVHQIPLVKDKHHQHQPQDPVQLSAHGAVLHKPSARNTPMLSFQPHHTEISTDRPSVSGRLLLHIPKIPHKKFHFVSLALHLRLKEAIGWTRQDLVTFELEKQGWSQTVWEKKMQLAFQDRQVEEGDEIYVAVIREPSKHSNSEGLGAGRIEIPADEWRWEWLLPVTDQEVRPESFEGSMGNVWYELEAKCLFRWDDVDQDGNARTPNVLCTANASASFAEPKLGHNHGHGLDRVQSGSSLLKGFEGPTRSLANAFGKLRVGQKTKKIQQAGDFKVGNQHDEFIKQSLRKRNETLLQAEALNSITDAHPQDPDNPNHELLPFLIRKILKLYFIKPPPNTSSNPSFFLPPPSMALPTLPGTRRLKAIIPNARIQVQIQIPSLIPIRGYAQTSQLIPDPKKGGLVLTKQGQQHSLFGDPQNKPPPQEGLSLHPRGLEINPRYLDNFQVALTVRKVTEQDINKNEQLKKRLQNVTSLPTHVSASAGRKQLLSETQHPPGVSVAGQHSQVSGSEIVSGTPVSSTAPIMTPQRRAWRRELRVRKVKCEFWQKESCRIPTSSSSSGSRTIKFALAPAFTYSDKEQERERMRSSMQLQRTHGPPQPAATVFWDNTAMTNSPPMENVDTESIFSMATRPLHPNSLSGHQLPTTTRGYGEEPVASHSASPSILPSSPSSALQLSHHTSPQNDSLHPSKPFMLLIPIPLDSPRLRQTFSWPSVETPSPLKKKSLDTTPLYMPNARSPRTRSASSPAGDGSAGYPTTQAIYNMAMMGTNVSPVNNEPAGCMDEAVASRSSGWGTVGSEGLDELEYSGERKQGKTGIAAIEESHQFAGMTRARDKAYDVDDTDIAPQELFNRSYRQYNHGSAHGPQTGEGGYRGPTAAQHAAIKSRIEVKHYLSFRLSIDVLEHEGEFEQDYKDLDLEAIEEHQLQLVKIRQELSAYGSNIIGDSISKGDRLSSWKDMPDDDGVLGPRSAHNGKFSAPEGTSSTLSEHTSATASVHTTSSAGSASAVTTSAVPLTSTTMQPALTFLNSTAGLLDPDSDFDFQQRTSGIRATSSISSQSGQSATYSIGAGGGPMAVVAGALEALKKKASSTALNAKTSLVAAGSNSDGLSQQQYHSKVPASSSHQFQPSFHQRTKSSAVQVKKLKDFVIRVPVTVVIQVDDLSQVGAADRQGASSDSGTQDHLLGEGGTFTEHDHSHSGDGIEADTHGETAPSCRNSMTDENGAPGTWQNLEKNGVSGTANQGPIAAIDATHLRTNAQQITERQATAFSSSESDSVVSSGPGSEFKSSSTVDSIENDYGEDDDAEYVEAQFIPDHL